MNVLQTNKQVSRSIAAADISRGIESALAVNIEDYKARPPSGCGGCFVAGEESAETCIALTLLGSREVLHELSLPLPQEGQKGDRHEIHKHP